MSSSPESTPLMTAALVAKKVGNSRSLPSMRPPTSHTMASTSRIMPLRMALTLYRRSKVDSGFSTTPKAEESTGWRWISGRATSTASLLDMLHLLRFDLIGEQHVVDLGLERLHRVGGAVARRAGQLRLHLAGMRRQQQDAAADLDRLGDGMGDEQHGEVRVVPQLQQLVLHLAPGQGVEGGV